MFVERQRGIVLAGFGEKSGIGVPSWLQEHTAPVFQRYRVTLMTNQAELYARLGDPERSANLLRDAALRNARTRSREKFSKMVRICAGWRRISDSSELEQLHEELRVSSPDRVRPDRADDGEVPPAGHHDSST
jgi:hypothetical protein